MTHYHQILDVPPDADLAAIKKAYRKKAMQLHPDHNPSPTAEADFIELTVAYENLTSKNKTTQYFTPSFEEERINTAARDYARMRYEKFVRRNSAYERLSIHKILWGKKTTWVILIFSCVFVYDNFAPPKKTILTNFNIEGNIEPAARSNYDYYVVSGNGLSFKTRDAFEIRKSSKIILEHTPLLKVVSAYTLDKDNFEIEYSPSVTIDEYRYLPAIVLLVCLITLFVKVRTFENKLLMKFAVIILMICYLTVFMIARF